MDVRDLNKFRMDDLSDVEMYADCLLAIFPDVAADPALLEAKGAEVAREQGANWSDEFRSALAAEFRRRAMMLRIQ